MKASIYDFTLKELSQLLKPSFRAKQLYLWLYAKYKTSFKDMQNNFSKDFIAYLEREFALRTIEITHVRESVDGSKKYLFKSLRDNHTFEAVLLKMKDKKIDAETNAILERKNTPYACLVKSAVKWVARFVSLKKAVL